MLSRNQGWLYIWSLQNSNKIWRLKYKIAGLTWLYIIWISQWSQEIMQVSARTFIKGLVSIFYTWAWERNTFSNRFRKKMRFMKIVYGQRQPSYSSHISLPTAKRIKWCPSRHLAWTKQDIIWDAVILAPKICSISQNCRSYTFTVCRQLVDIKSYVSAWQRKRVFHNLTNLIHA